MEHILANWEWILVGFLFGTLLGFTLGIMFHVWLEKSKLREKYLEEINQDFDRIK